MAKDYNILIAGFGGQGVLFAGKVLAYCGMINNKQISWLPSYGPEMRGGTANCSICISDESVGSPLVLSPNVFVAMNTPSFDRFINDVESGASVFIDSSLIDRKVKRTDINVFYIPATKLALDENLKGLANMIILGKVFKELELFSVESLHDAIKKCVPAKKAQLLDLNFKAIEIGLNIE